MFETKTSESQDEMVLLPIPKRFYPAVVQFLGEMISSELSGKALPDLGPMPSSASSDPNRPWTRDDIRQLRAMVRNPTILAVFELAKERGGDLVSFRDLEEYTKRKYGQVRADLAGLTRMVRTRLNHEHWPFEAVWAADGTPSMSYRVPENVLQWWHEQ